MIRLFIIRLSIFIVSILFSFTAIAQNEAKIPSYGFNYKVRALINEDIVIFEIPQLEDTTSLVLLKQKTLPYRKFLKTKKVAVRETYEHWRFSVTGGVGTRIARISKKIEGDIAKRKKNLRNGFFLGIDAGHFLSENIGVGVKYNYFMTNNVIDNFEGALPNNEDFKGQISDKVNIHYVGPAVLLRSVSRNKKILANCDLSIGYTGYRNNNKLNDKSYLITGHNVSFSSSIGVDFKINRSMAIGFNLSIMAASLKNVKIDGTKYSLNDNNVENLSRITFGTAFRLYK